MKMIKTFVTATTLLTAASFANATPMLSGSLSLTGYASIDPSMNQIAFMPGSTLSVYGETGSFTALGSGGAVVFNNQGTSINFLNLASNSNLNCGTGCIYTATSQDNSLTTTFNLASESVLQMGTTLTISGVGTATLTGFDPTPGYFELTSQGLGLQNLSFSSTTSVPEPETLALFGAGLFGLFLAVGMRRRRRD